MKSTRVIYLICILIALTLVFFTFSGCTENENNTQITAETDDSYEIDESDESNEVGDGFVADCRDGHENINGNTHANLANGGIAAEQDGWIYFYTQPQNGNSKSGKIFKHKAYETETIEIASFDRLVSRLSVKGDYIYYLDGADSLYKMRTDGTDIQPVFFSDEIDSSQYMIIGDYIYVIKEEQQSSTSSTKYVVRYPIDNVTDCEKLYKLDEDERYYGATSKYIITRNKPQSLIGITLSVYNIETKETKTHVGSFFNDLQFTEDAVFYTNESTTTITKVNLDDMSVTNASNDNLVAQAFNFVDENTIYFTYGNYKTEIFDMKSKLAESSMSMLEEGSFYSILEESARSICIVGDWIYYTSGNPLTNYCRVKTDGTDWEMLYEYV